MYVSNTCIMGGCLNPISCNLYHSSKFMDDHINYTVNQFPKYCICKSKMYFLKNDLLRNILPSFYKLSTNITHRANRLHCIKGGRPTIRDTTLKKSLERLYAAFYINLK